MAAVRWAILLITAAAAASMTACHSLPSGNDSAPIVHEYYGQSARDAARDVKGCTDVVEVPVKRAQNPSVTSMASCVLDGHVVTFATYPSAKAQNDTDSTDFTTVAPRGYFAEGAGYWAAADLAKSDVATDRDVARTVIKSLGGSVVEFSNAKGPAPSSGQPS